MITLNICFKGNIGRPGPAGSIGPPGQGIQGPKVSGLFQGLTKIFIVWINSHLYFFIVRVKQYDVIGAQC